MFKKTLEGLEAATVDFLNIDLGDRFDAEFFYKNSLDLENKLMSRNAIPFSFFGDLVASAFYPGATELYQFGTVPFIRCVDCIPYPFITKSQDKLFEKLPIDFVEAQAGISGLSKGEIVITKVGSPCYASIIEEHDFVALSRTVLGIKNIRNIDPYYLLTFLRCKYGFQQLLRQRELTIQYQLTLDRVKKILIYKPKDGFEEIIKGIVLKYNLLSKEATNIYAKAEEFFLYHVNLLDWQPPQETTAVKSFKESFLQSGRLDAEYYQPKYFEIIEQAKRGNYDYLGNLVKVKKSIEPGSDAYLVEGIPFIRVAELFKFGLSEPEIFLDPNQYDVEYLMPKKNDILLSKDGSVGIAYKMQEDKEVITSGAILHLSIVDRKVLPDYLCLVLNSIVVQYQAERDAGGSIIQHWKPDQIKQVVIPILSPSYQEKITELVQQCFSLQNQSKKLLHAAIHAVELSIEENEGIAIQWLENQNIT